MHSEIVYKRIGSFRLIKIAIQFLIESNNPVLKNKKSGCQKTRKTNDMLHGQSISTQPLHVNNNNKLSK